MKNSSIAFIGAGNLAQALIAGLLSAGCLPGKIWAADPFAEKLEALQRCFGVHITESNSLAVKEAEVVVLAVKPDHVRGVCLEIKDLVLSRNVLIISVAAGVTIPLLREWISLNAALVRAMPNTPVIVGAGVTGLICNNEVSSIQRDLAEAIFRAVGIVLWLEDEKHLDLVCAISGCGPGYLFLIMEAIVETAKRYGLKEPDARLLTAQTFLGSARLALESPDSLVELRRRVTSPRGVTEGAIAILEKGGIQALLASAIEGALERSEEISRELK